MKVVLWSLLVVCSIHRLSAEPLVGFGDAPRIVFGTSQDEFIKAYPQAQKLVSSNGSATFSLLPPHSADADEVVFVFHGGRLVRMDHNYSKTRLKERGGWQVDYEALSGMFGGPGSPAQTDGSKLVFRWRAENSPEDALLDVRMDESATISFGSSGGDLERSAGGGIKNSSGNRFSLPKCIEFTYPETFRPESSSSVGAAFKQAHEMLERAGTIASASSDMTVLVLQHDGNDYGHFSVSVHGPEISQADVQAAEDDSIANFASEMQSRLEHLYVSNGLEITQPPVSKKLSLPSGLLAVDTRHQYRMPDGKIRNNRKVQIFTDRFTVSCGITTSGDASATALNDIESILDSIRLAQ